MDEDYYKILEINRNASEADIQKAYRKLARKYHPDLHPDDKTAKEKFQQVQKAYDVLNNPEKREMYDRYGSAFESMAGGGPRGGPTGGWQTYHGGGPEGFEDIDFSQLFGQQRGRGGSFGGFGDIFRQFAGGAGQTRSAGRPRGSDLQHELQIPFQTSITGGEARLIVQREDGKKESIKVKIPQGIEDGKKIRLRGQGERLQAKAPPGDLLITIHVSPHPFFQRKGRNLEVKVPVSVSEAALGAKVDVPTPHGTISLQIPPGTSSGTRLRVKGHGVRSKDQPDGDLVAEVQIMIPARLDEQSKEFFRKLADSSPIDPRKDLKW